MKMKKKLNLKPILKKKKKKRKGLGLEDIYCFEDTTEKKELLLVKFEKREE